MRKYRIIVQELALRDLDDAYGFAAQHAPESAAAWLARFEATLQSLDHNPDRCSHARPQVSLSQPPVFLPQTTGRNSDPSLIPDV